MLCSFSTGKSSSTWLDRLRSSKGFPAGNDLDLEHFLRSSPNISNSSNSSSISPSLNSDSAQIERRRAADRKKTTHVEGVEENDEKQWFRIMSDVLEDLFNMGDSSSQIRRFNRKKSLRKQPNPKLYVVSSSLITNEGSLDGVQRDRGVSVSVENRLMENEKESNDNIKLTEKGDADSVGVEEDNCNTNLSGYSCTEVTVIDTSCPSWKFDKLLYRRKNVWKVRDKKCKFGNLNRKKRKAILYDKKVGEEKKPKLSLRFGSVEANGEETRLPSNKENSQKDLRKEACKELSDILNQVTKTRFRFSRSPRKFGTGGSSIIKIKGIAKGKQNGAKIQRSSLGDTPRKYKA